jgi:hypothetical protein
MERETPKADRDEAALRAPRRRRLESLFTSASEVSIGVLLDAFASGQPVDLEHIYDVGGRRVEIRVKSAAPRNPARR